MTLPTASVVIVTYNRIAFLPETLAAVENLRHRSFELVIVNGPSTDGTGDYLQQHWSTRATLVDCPVANVSVARNLGIAAANGDIVCFIDDDGIAEPDWLDRLLAPYADPRVAAVGGFVRDHTGVAFQTRGIVSRRDSSSHTQARIDHLPQCVPLAEEFPALIGVNSSYRRSALLAVGGFDETYEYYLEETDLVLRLIDAGYLVSMQADAEVHHKYAPSDLRTADRIPTRWKQVMASTAYYILRNAVPGTRLADSIEKIEAQRRVYEDISHHLFANGSIDGAARDALLADLSPGMRHGIFQAFETPQRRLARLPSAATWQPLKRRHDERPRLRLAFVCRAAADDDGTNAALRTMAGALAAMGHEVSLILPASMARQATVDFDAGQWVHRLVDDDSVAPGDATTQLPLPEMPPRRRRHALAVIDELIRVEPRRRFDFVIGNGWEMAAVVATQAFPSVLGLQPSAPDWRGAPGFEWLAGRATHDLRDAPGQRTAEGLEYLLCGLLAGDRTRDGRARIDAIDASRRKERDAA